MTVDFERYGVLPGSGERRIGFYLPDTFGMLPFISALEPLRAANRYRQKHLYSWHLFGESNAPAIANNGMEQHVEGSLNEARELDRLIICGPHDPLVEENSATLSALKRIARSGTSMGALDTGTYLLAQARLLGNRRCTLHWENLPGFAEHFPDIRVSSELFEIDDGLFTCAGGDAALDMMLTLIARDHGKELAMRVAELFIHPAIRHAHEPQRMGVSQRTGVFHSGLVSCVELMEANLEQPLSTQELAEMVNMSKRHLERLFRLHLQTTPTLYYQQIRLRAAIPMLEQTSLSMSEIAVACGFSSSEYFSKRFRVCFGHSPRELRKTKTQ